MNATNCHPVPRWRRLLFRVAIAGMVFVLGGELLLQAAVRLSPRIRYTLLPPWRQRLPQEREKLTIPHALDDPLFGCRGNPAHPNHDRWGFHNTEVPERADIVAIGDSHTYGALLSTEQAWPAVLQQLSGAEVYNMGFGGWGPVEYLLSVDQALSLQPKTIVFGVYFGNDLFDCFRAVYVRGAVPEFVNPEVVTELAQLEAQGDLQSEATRLFWIPPETAVPEAAEGGLGRARFWVAEHCQLYALARLVKNCCSPAQVQATTFAPDSEEAWQYAVRWAAGHPEDCAVMDFGEVRTVLTAPYRRVALDLDDPRINEGLNLGCQALSAAAEKCRARGVRPVVVLLPTKELVFSVLALDRVSADSHPKEVQDPYPGLAELVNAELAVRKRLTSYLDEQGIAWIDTLPLLRVCFENPGTQPYPASMDGHPNAIGQRIIARTLQASLPRSHARQDDRTASAAPLP